MKRTTICLFCFVLLLLPTTAAAQTTTVTYTPSAAPLANPERGFYKYEQIDASNPFVWDTGYLTSWRTDENITLIYCLFVLDTFVDSPISDGFLQTITDNLNVVRDAGLKCVLRFAYTYTPSADTSGNGEPDPPYGDADKATILGHIDQLEPLIQAHSDVIAVWQAGFIGIWGEWYYTDHFVDDPAVPYTISAAQYAHRGDVLTRQLDALPVSRMAQVRYAAVKRQMTGTTLDQPLDSAAAFTDNPLARIGYHNDCFLASDTDYGTFDGDNLAQDKAFYAQETRYMPMGGESCNFNPPRSDCATAAAELALFHYTYLNIGYSPDVLNSWRTGGCFDAIENALGYRLRLTEGTFDTAVRPGAAVQFALSLVNDGYAAPINPRAVSLVLQDENNRYSVDLPEDPRMWLPDGEIALAHAITIPTCVPEGSYDLLLHLPDPEPTLRPRPAYAIQLANDGIYDTATGYHQLATIDVSSQAADTAAGDDLAFASADCVATPLATTLQTQTAQLPMLAMGLIALLGMAAVTIYLLPDY